MYIHTVYVYIIECDSTPCIRKDDAKNGGLYHAYIIDDITYMHTIYCTYIQTYVCTYYKMEQYLYSWFGERSRKKCAHISTGAQVTDVRMGNSIVHKTGFNVRIY